MGDLIQFPGCSTPESEFYQCPSCGGEHWVAIVLFEKDGQLAGYVAESDGESIPECIECGEAKPGDV